MFMNQKTLSFGSHRFAFVMGLITAAAIVLRLVALIFSHAPVGEADSTIRVFYAINWLQNPYVFCPTTWPPLQFYIYGIALALWFDPIYTPLAVNIMCAGLLVLSMGFLVRRLMQSEEAGWIAAVLVALYPLAIRYSLIAQPEIMLNCLIAATLLFLLRAGSAAEDRNINRNDIMAAVLMAMACWTHMEAWFLAPVFALLLWRRWRRLAFFLLVAAIPILAFVIHTRMTYGGVPAEWYAYSYGATNTMRQLLYYPALLIKTLTPAIVLLAVVGLVHLVQNHSQEWKTQLFPALCLVLLAVPYLFFVFAWDRTKPKEAILLSLFIIPYAALGLVQIKNLLKGALARWLIVAIAAGMLLIAPYNWKYLGFGGIFPVPRTTAENVKTAAWLKRHVTPVEGVVFDHLPLYADFYMASALRALPDQVLLTLEWPAEEVKRRLDRYLSRQQPRHLVLSRQPGTVSRLLALKCTSQGCPTNFWEPLFQATYEKRFQSAHYVVYTRNND